MTMTTESRVTNASVGQVLDLDQSYVSLIRRGLRVPSREVAARIMAHYQADPIEFTRAYLDSDPMVFAKYFTSLVGLEGVPSD